MGAIIGALIGRHYGQKWMEESSLVKSAMENIQEAFKPGSTATDDFIDMNMNILRQRPGLKKMMPQIEAGIQRARADRDARAQQPQQPPQVAPEAAVTNGRPLPSPGLQPPPPAEPPQLAPAFRSPVPGGSPVGGGSEGGPAPLLAPPAEGPPPFPPPNQVQLPPQVAGPSQAGGAGFGLPDYSTVPGRIFNERPYAVGLRKVAGEMPGAQAQLGLAQQTAANQLQNEKNVMAWLTKPTSEGGPGMTVEQAADYIKGKQAQFMPTTLVKPGEILTRAAGPRAGEPLTIGANVLKDVGAGAALTSTPTVPGMAPGAVPASGIVAPGAPIPVTGPVAAVPAPGTPLLPPTTTVLPQQPELIDPIDRAAKAAFIAQRKQKDPGYQWSDADLPTARKAYNDAVRVVGGDMEQYKTALRAAHPDWSDQQVGQQAGRMVIEKFQNLIETGQPLTAGQIHNMALLAAQTGRMPNFGMGKSKVKDQFNRAYADAIGEMGGPNSVAAYQQEYKASGRALGDLETMRSKIGSFEDAFRKDLDLAEAAAMKVPRTQSSKFNSWVQLLKADLTDYPELSAFRVSTQTAVNQYATLMYNASGRSSNDARADAAGLIDKAMAAQSYDAAIKQMKLEAKNRVAGLDEEIKRRREELRSGPLQAPPAQKMIHAFDEKGVLHEAPEGTPLPRGWKLK